MIEPKWKNPVDAWRAKFNDGLNCTNCEHIYLEQDDEDEPWCSKRKTDPMPQVGDIDQTYCRLFKHKRGVDQSE